MLKIAENEPPTEEVINLRNQGKNNDEIVEELSKKNFNNQQISEAINQADIKGGVEGKIPPATQPEIPTPEGLEPGMKPSALSTGIAEPEIPIPSPASIGPAKPAPPEEAIVPELQQPPPNNVFIPTQQPSMDIETIHETVEAIIDERWQEVVASIGDISLWKSRIEDDISSIKQEVLRIEDRFTKLQASIIGKVDEYQKGITHVSNEMVALEKVFGKIMEPLTSNIKELKRITQNIKK